MRNLDPLDAWPFTGSGGNAGGGSDLYRNSNPLLTGEETAALIRGDALSDRQHQPLQISPAQAAAPARDTSAPASTVVSASLSALAKQLGRQAAREIFRRAAEPAISPLQADSSRADVSESRDRLGPLQRHGIRRLLPGDGDCS